MSFVEVVGSNGELQAVCNVTNDGIRFVGPDHTPFLVGLAEDALFCSQQFNKALLGEFRVVAFSGR